MILDFVCFKLYVERHFSPLPVYIYYNCTILNLSMQIKALYQNTNTAFHH